MAVTSVSEPTEEHIDWLLISAYNYLQQDLPDQAVVLLEFLRVFDSANHQCLKMLAYGYFLQGKMRQSAELIREVQQLPLPEAEHAAVRLLRLRMSQNNGQADEMKRLYQDYNEATDGRAGR